MQLPIISDPEKPSLRAGDKQSEGQRGRYAVVSLGCPKNLVDTEQMLGRLDEDGYQMTDTVDDADFVVVHDRVLESLTDSQGGTMPLSVLKKLPDHCWPGFLRSYANTASAGSITEN